MRPTLAQATRAPLIGAAAALALVAALLAPGTPAAGAPALGPVIDLPAQPESVTPGPDGAMWVALSSVGADDLARITPAGVVTTYDVPGVVSFADITAGPDGNLWATTSNAVVRIPPAAPTTATVVPVAAFSGRGITAGPDGNLWAAGGDRVLRIPPADPAALTPFTVAGMDAREVVAGTDGRIWVADFSGRVIAVSLDGTFLAHPTGGNPQGIAAGPAGQVLYTVPPSSAGLLTYGAAAQPVALPAGSDPSFSATFAADGAYWVGLFNTAEVARITTTGQVTRLGGFGATYKPRHVATGPGDTVWVSLQDPPNAGRVAIVTGVSAPPAPAPSDTSVSVAIAGSRLSVAPRTRRTVLRLGCPASETSSPCVVTVRVTARDKPRVAVVARTTAAVAAGTTKRVRLRVKPPALARLRATRGGLRVRVVVQVRDGVGNTATVRKSMKLVLKRG